MMNYIDNSNLFNVGFELADEPDRMEDESYKQN